MKKISISALVGILFIGLNSGAQELARSTAEHDPYFDIGSTETRVTEQIEVARPFSSIQLKNKLETYESPQQTAAPLQTVQGPLMIADLVLRVWSIIVANKPVVTVDSKAANALPLLAKDHWEQLTGWKPERWIGLTTTIKNGFGMRVIDLSYQVRLIYGGSVHGQGLYIASAQVVPTSINVLWGFNLNVMVDVASVVNVGTAESPAGQITLNVTKIYGSTFASHTEVSRFTVNAAGMMKNATTDQVYFSSNQKLLPGAQE